MICKDCIHVEVCREYVTGLAIARGVELNETELEQVLVCDDCEHCADRSRFVELPCKVGDTVWFILTDLDDIDLKDYTVTAERCAINNGDIVTEIGTSGFWYQAIYDDGRTKTFNPSNDDFCEWDELGKTVFLTREEAEQALKERKENPGG